MSKLRLFLLTGFLTAAIAPLYGCGSECGPGTTEQDGECVLLAQGCGSGTILSNKQCIVDTSGCGQGTTLVDEQCVPADTSCGEGTTFDEMLRLCVSNAEIVCGEATEVNAEGVCVSSGEACGPKTKLDDQGRCIIEAAVCGQGTTLDPNTGECVLGDAACGAGLALGSDGECELTDEVCQAGTKFDADSRLCLPDACQEGDMLVNGVCLSPMEQDANNVDLIEAENNDPAFGGTAEMLTVHPVGDGAFSFSGTIGAPTDLSGDLSVDQDIDVFEFEATAGDWLQIGVQSVGLPAPAFVVNGPHGYVRWSQINLAAQTARHIVIPEDGTYSVSVLPSLTLQSPEVGPSGGAGWGYMGTIEAISAPTATDHDIAGGSAQFSGEFDDLSDNLFSLSGVTTDDVVTFTFDHVGEQAEGVLQVWGDATTFHDSQPIVAGERVVVGVPATGNATVFIDWTKAYGTNQGFTISAEISGDQRLMTIPAGDTGSVTVTLSQFDRLVTSQRNTDDADLDVAVIDPSGTEIVSQSLAPEVELDQAVFADGVYTIEVTNNTSSDTQAAIFLSVRPPVDLGPISTESTTTSPGGAITGGDKTYYAFTATAGQFVSFSHDNNEDQELAMALLDANGDTITQASSLSTSSNAGLDYVYWYLQSGGTFAVVLEAGVDVTGQTLTVESSTPTDLGSLSLSQVHTRSSSAGLSAGESDLYLFSIPEGTTVAAKTLVPNVEDTDLYVYDLQMNELASETSTSPADLSGVMIGAGDYLVQVAAAAATPYYDLEITLGSALFTSSPALAIPDYSSATGTSTTVSDTLAVSGGCATLASVIVYVEITHTYTGDLVVDLVSPNGTRVTLHDRSGGTTEDILGWYPNDLPVDGPGALADFSGEASDGDWSIEVTDNAGSDTGTLDGWALGFSCQ